jgi:hypothetical protein
MFIKKEPVEPMAKLIAPPTIHVSVRWFDSYLEEFEAHEVRFGSDYIWIRLKNGQNRHIPLRNVRWFSVTPESHSKSLE